MMTRQVMPSLIVEQRLKPRLVTEQRLQLTLRHQFKKAAVKPVTLSLTDLLVAFSLSLDDVVELVRLSVAVSNLNVEMNCMGFLL